MRSELTVVQTTLPDLVKASLQIQEVVDAGAADALDEIRRRAEAHALYENRSGHAEREHHFAQLRVMAEAGIGALSFDDPTVHACSEWRTMAAAFERGKFIEAIASSRPDFYTGRWRPWTHIYGLGYGWAPGRIFGRKQSLRWSEARIVAREHDIQFSTIPPDKAQVLRMAERGAKAWAVRKQNEANRGEALRKLTHLERQKAIAKAARDRSDHLGKGYAFLRKALDEFDAAQRELTAAERPTMGEAFAAIYKAEDRIGELLRVADKVAA